MNLLYMLHRVGAWLLLLVGQHDFDFNFGAWHTRIRRLQQPLSGSAKWEDVSGTVVIRKVWGGRANLEELAIDGPGGHVEGLTLHLYNPKANQWSLNWASSDDGTLTVPAVGEFKNGRGEFYDRESFNDRSILVRNAYSNATASSYHFEVAYSADGGKTWEPNFIANLTPDANGRIVPSDTGQRSHDFDFNFGAWKTHIRRLAHPLTGSNTWVDYEGTHTVRTVWNGKANLGELEVDGPGGHLEWLSLRLYNPQSHQWTLNFANSGEGTLGVPAVGEFKNGRGEFYDQETYNGRAVLVRMVWSDITPTTCHLEQAFSVDGGKTWEVNWVAADTLISRDVRAE